MNSRRSKKGKPGATREPGQKQVAQRLRPDSQADRNREEATGAGVLDGFKLLMAKPVSGASLAAVRMAAGLSMVLEVYSLCSSSRMISGKIPLENYYAGPDIKFNFPYRAFEWLPLLPAPWMHALVGTLAVAGALVALGVWYRVAAVVVFLAWGYLFVVESTRTYFQSYYYIELLLTFLLMWMPAARRYSVDAWLARNRDAPRTVPFWTVFLLRGQLLIMYFYAGVAKLNADWLLDAAPLRWRLKEPHVMNFFQALLGPGHSEWVKDILHSLPTAYFLSYAGVVFDLAIGFLFLIRRTRILAMILMTLFHATNHFIIYDNIDWYPLVGLTTATIFLDPDWPERVWRWLRRPRLSKPSWPWLTAGAILCPVVGAALGWKARATDAEPNKGRAHVLGRSTATLVSLWLVWQALMPLRQYLVPGDARITQEGLSFSWRLKTDEHSAMSANFFVRDPRILPPGNNATINWDAWHGEKVLYRYVNAGQIDWRQLPQIVAVVEPVVGERIVYNPVGRGAAVRSEAEARERVRSLWQATYGREPQAIRLTTPLSQVIESITAALQNGGHGKEASNFLWRAARTKEMEQTPQRSTAAAKNRQAILDLLTEFQHRDKDGALEPYLRLVYPFALEGEPIRQLPFLEIEDAQVVDGAAGGPFRIKAGVWRQPAGMGAVYERGERLVIYSANSCPESSALLPQSCIFDTQGHPEIPPYIWWNTLKDANVSKLDHISNQPFYLCRYARRIAGLWEEEYGRRPEVTASTGVSLNHRPHQELADPNMDLASVRVAWFGHNAWIRDLETPRIPRNAL